MGILKDYKKSLRIIYYHLVTDNDPGYYFSQKAISAVMFKKHIKYFKKHFQIISLDNAINLASDGKPLGGKLVITIDDGFRENHSTIAPILYDEKVDATFFFTTNFIDNNDMMWRNKLLLINKNKPQNFYKILNNISSQYKLPNIKINQNLMQWSLENWSMELKETIVNKLWSEVMSFSVSEYLEENRPYCSRSQIKEIIDSGFGLGSHSLSHPVFSKLNYKEVSKEIIKSSEELSVLSGKNIKYFSYPFGIRAKEKYEDKFFKEQNAEWKFFGINNSFNNFGRNLNVWERDNVEFPFSITLIRFSLLPIFRSFVR